MNAVTDNYRTRRQRHAAEQLRALRIAADAWNQRVHDIAAEETAAHYTPALIAEIEQHLRETSR